MPKMKTHKATAKRIRVTRRGKLIHAKGSAGHLKTKKRRHTRKASTKRFTLSPAFAKRVRVLLRGG
ncbi:MAG: 50S ribosomal protein L35 [Chloroflexi bacterium]|nr:50S ribosomal protein L35 [Chloroflexota bacterium]MCY3937426.1 50S ribosomal protein L35 [Chloroflexota bacterium]